MRGVAIYAGLLAAAVALFLLLPQIDLWASGLFYVRGEGFALAHWPPVVFVFRSIPWLACGIVLVVLGAAAWLFLVGRPLWRFDRKELLFLIAFRLALGPGLSTNTVLKDHWGRARPVQVDGVRRVRTISPRRRCRPTSARPTARLSPAMRLSAFSLVAFAFLLPAGRPRRRGIGAALAFGGLVGLVRIAQGGHFLSDVVFAGLWCSARRRCSTGGSSNATGLPQPPLLRLYGGVGRGALSAWRSPPNAGHRPSVRIGTAVGATAILVVISIGFVDRPVALYLHARGPDLHALFGLTGELGEGWGWLVLFALGFAGLHWGGELPRLRPAPGRCAGCRRFRHFCSPRSRPPVWPSTS